MNERDWSQESFHGNDTLGVIRFLFWCTMHISGAKFVEHCFNISRDIVYSVFYHFLAVQLLTSSPLHHDVIVSLSLKRKEIVFLKVKYFERPFTYAGNILYVIYALKSSKKDHKTKASL